MINSGIVAQVITFVLGWGSVLAILMKYLKPAKEAGELLTTIVAALSDGKLTEDEIKNVIKEAKDVKEAIKALK